MKTSYFTKAGNNINAVAICRYPPVWFTGKRYAALAPSAELLSARINGKISEIEFGRRYQEETLNKLDPIQVYNDLGEDVILLCWEPTGRFCHRQLVANWLVAHVGKPVRELDEYRNGVPLDWFGQ